MKDFLDMLKGSPRNGMVFNPWWEVDLQNDIGPQAPEIRKEQLRRYLEERVEKARYLLIGEAVGYQGGHFTGIAMTSERILLGFKRDEGIHPEDVFAGLEPRRTSRPEISPKGFSEPTATIVWSFLLGMGIPSREFVLWNTFPWHPFDPGRGTLSNRMPGEEELRSAEEILKTFLSIFHGRTVIAVGRIAERRLERLGFDSRPVRHPACGGAAKFREGIAAIMGGGAARSHR